MPPLRTMPPAKPVKTERTHAENQERAYIAASRRSDRSLEARVESARRASEIHKKRTGRSLRVTEADVINEEMYEEEDDDLPAQIRRITAHLHTGNDPFNRRLQAYVANHIAMRSALGQVVADNWQQQQNMNFNPAPQQNFAFQTPMLPPQMPARSPQMYRSAPYPVPSPRAEPLMSPPQTSSSHSSPVEVKQRPGPLNLTDPIFSNPFGTNVAPLTATLPLESQQLLAGAPIDLNDPSMAAMMQTHLVPTPGGNFAPAPGFYSYNPNGKKKSVSPKSEKPTKNMGMNATLAPSMLDVVAPPTFPENDLFSPHTPAGFGFGFEYGNDFVPHDEPLSGQLTPGETDWNTWIEPQALGEEVTSQ